MPGDYYLFVDDDDWMFPNKASALREMLRVCPRNSVFFADSRHYIEGRARQDNVFVGSKLTYGRYFPGNRFMESISGVNQSPFCSVVFPRKTFQELDPRAYTTVEYAEDYFLILRTLYQECVPFVFVGQLVGISIRAKANVAYALANSPNLSQGKFALIGQTALGRGGSLLARTLITLFDGRLLKIAFRYKVLEKIIRGQISPRYAISKLVSLIKQGW
jgi:hypothetical protein